MMRYGPSYVDEDHPDKFQRTDFLSIYLDEDDSYPQYQFRINVDGDLEIHYQTMTGPGRISIIPGSSNVIQLRPVN